MKRIVFATSLAVALSAAAAWATPGQTAPAQDPKIGTRVTIAGCLHQGTADDSYVLLNVTERSADSVAINMAPPPAAIYWLDSTKGLGERVGEIIEVTGTVSERDAKYGTITVKNDPTKVMGKDVKVTTTDETATSEKFNPKAPKPGDPKPAGTTVSAVRVYQLSVDKVHTLTKPVNGQPCR